MIVCRRCSRRHPDGTEFCTCGAYLDFDGQTVADEQTGVDQRDPASGNREAPRQTGGSSPNEPAPWSGLEPSAAPDSDDATAVLPVETVRRDRPADVQREGMVRPGDLRCTACGSRSPAGSRFCRHCGNDLADSAAGLVVEDSGQRKRRWPWSRGGALSRDAAQQRPQASGRRLARRVVLLRTGGVVLVIAMLAAFLGPWRGRVSSGLGDGLQLTRYDQIEVAPERVRAGRAADPVEMGSTLPYRTAERVVDGFSNTAWATRWDDLSDLGEDSDSTEPSCGAWRAEDVLVIEFPEPTDIDRLQVLGGRSAADPSRNDFYRPRLLQLAAGDQDCALASIEDTGELVKLDVAFDDVTTLVVGVAALYDGGGTDATVEISELVFEQK